MAVGFVFLFAGGYGSGALSCAFVIAGCFGWLALSLAFLIGRRSGWLLLSSAITAEYRLDRTRTFIARQRHWLRRVDGALRIVRKRVDLVNCEGAFEAIAVPV